MKKLTAIIIIILTIATGAFILTNSVKIVSDRVSVLTDALQKVSTP